MLAGSLFLKFYSYLYIKELGFAMLFQRLKKIIIYTSFINVNENILKLLVGAIM